MQGENQCNVVKPKSEHSDGWGRCILEYGHEEPHKWQYYAADVVRPNS